MTYYKYALALLFVTTGCMAEEPDRIEIRFVPGASLDEVFPATVRDELEIVDQLRRPAPIVIGKPHRLRLQLGGREIVVSPGGYNPGAMSSPAILLEVTISIRVR